MNCIPIESVPILMDKVLAEAGASKEVRAKATSIANELRTVGGQVVLVQTDAAVRSIYVASVGQAGTTMGRFNFPPNGPANEAELIRAQDTSRNASVTYRTDAQGENIITSILIYAGPAAGSNAPARY